MPILTELFGKTVEILDISPRISPEIAVFPGDHPVERKITPSFESENYFLLSSIHTTVHVGAHADATNHYSPEGKGIEARPLELYFGQCQVISVDLPRGKPIEIAHLEERKILAPRVLFKTGSYPDPNHWNTDFNWFSIEIIQHLAQVGVKLVGIDTPSVDPSDAKALKTHQEVYRNNLGILEGLVLEKIEDGLYHLCALPLSMGDFDAAPVRAVLLRRPQGNPT